MGILVWSFLLQAPSPLATMWDGSLSWPRLPVQQLRLAGWFLTGLCFPFPNLRDGMKTCFRLQFHRSFMPSSFLCLSLLLQLVPVDSQIRLGLVGWDCFHPHGWSWVPRPLSLLCASRWSGNVFRSPGSDWVGTGAGQTAGRLTPGSSQPGGAQEEVQ